MESLLDMEKFEVEGVCVLNSSGEELSTEFEQFSDRLNDARWLWRRYPHLVESPSFPEPFLSVFRNFVNQQNRHSPDSLNGPDEGNICGEKELLERGILKSAEPRESLTLHEIRKLTHSYLGLPFEARNAAIDKELAASFSASDSDEDELAHLARCQAIYRRQSGSCQEVDPAGRLIVDLTQKSCERFVGYSWVAMLLDEAEDDWEDRAKIVATGIQDEEIERLRATPEDDSLSHKLSVYSASLDSINANLKTLSALNEGVRVALEGIHAGLVGAK